MKNKFIRILITCFALAMLLVTAAGAIVPYSTYTYSYEGNRLPSPHAYVPLTVVDSSSLLASLEEGGGASDNAKIQYAGNDSFTGLDSPQDLFVDDLNHVYIANTGKNQVVVTDENYNVRLVISDFINQFGVPDSFNSPRGLFVTSDEIFVADTENSRIVVFDKLGNFVDVVPEPESEVLPENHIYKPIAVAVDKAGRIYAVSSTGNMGVISLNRDGSFNGFIGPQKVAGSLATRIKRLFQTQAQIDSDERLVSKEFNNLCIDPDGFIYVTLDSIDATQVESAINSRSKSGDYAPVKKLNPNGNDVMSRNGFWPPSGEVTIRSTRFAYDNNAVSGPSTLYDVAIGPDNTWSVIDNKRSRVFTYDSTGNLLFAFGDKGNQVGNISNLVAIDYQGTNILLLDRSRGSVTVYKRTNYGDLLLQAIRVTEDKQYEKSVQYYVGILQRNNNYDTAYVGIGQSQYRDGEYLKAMKNFKQATDVTDYSNAYKMYRKEWIEKYLWTIPVAIFLIIFGLAKFFKFANKVNRKGRLATEKTTFGQEILYGFHIIFHPFDGFWDLKHEKRGSVRGATFWLVITALTFVYKAAGQSYIVDQSEGSGASYFFAAISIISPVLLWVIANWCLTTLFDGEGTLKDVYVATCYTLVPLPLLIIPSVIFSNIVTITEVDILSMLVTISYVWLFLLLFFGMMVTHDYTLGKNLLTVIGTIVGIAFIAFIASLFSLLMNRLFTFFYNIYVELSLRWS